MLGDTAKYFDFKPSESVRQLIGCLDSMNFVFLNS